MQTLICPIADLYRFKYYLISKINCQTLFLNLKQIMIQTLICPIADLYHVEDYSMNENESQQKIFE